MSPALIIDEFEYRPFTENSRLRGSDLRKPQVLGCCNEYSRTRLNASRLCGG